MKRNIHLLSRRIHRYLGLVIGIQFLLWTLGGLYFSWSDMDQVHGDHHRKAAPLMPVNLELVSPKMVLKGLGQIHPTDSLLSIELIQVLGLAVYRIRILSKDSHHPKVLMANALTGQLRPPLSQTEAISIANSAFNGHSAIVSVQYLTATSNHHEYRQQPLPAYAVNYGKPDDATVYVATQLGTVQKVRNNSWRAFDFLWMLHTMDYQSRDNIGNWLLRIFSVLGLLTIISGFVLYGLSSKTLRGILSGKGNFSSKAIQRKARVRQNKRSALPLFTKNISNKNRS